MTNRNLSIDEIEWGDVNYERARRGDPFERPFSPRSFSSMKSAALRHQSSVLSARLFMSRPSVGSDREVLAKAMHLDASGVLRPSSLYTAKAGVVLLSEDQARLFATVLCRSPHPPLVAPYLEFAPWLEGRFVLAKSAWMAGAPVILRSPPVKQEPFLQSQPVSEPASGFPDETSMGRIMDGIAHFIATGTMPDDVSCDDEPAIFVSSIEDAPAPVCVPSHPLTLFERLNEQRHDDEESAEALDLVSADVPDVQDLVGPAPGVDAVVMSLAYRDDGRVLFLYRGRMSRKRSEALLAIFQGSSSGGIPSGDVVVHDEGSDVRFQCDVVLDPSCVPLILRAIGDPVHSSRRSVLDGLARAFRRA